MFNIRIPQIFPALKGKKCFSSLIELNTKKEQIIDKIRAYRIAENLDPLDLSNNIDKDGFVEYQGAFIKNYTTAALHKKGVTILELKTDKDVVFESHDHDHQTQFIYVTKGKISDLKSGFTFNKSQHYSVPKRQEHLIKYFADTNAMIVYMPNLKPIQDA